MTKRLSFKALCLTTVSLVACQSQAFAAEEASNSKEMVLEEVRVTGSRIKRDTFDTPAPVEILGKSSIDGSGVPTITDLVKNMTINSGSNFNMDFSTQRQTAGTAQVALRGLGLNSTLTLVNGRRTTLSAMANDPGETFVDINQYPLLMIDRIEVLKDGAAAIYGSDAVAGVFNLVTRKGFSGLEMDVSYQTTTKSNQSDLSVSMAWGAGNEDYHINAYWTYFKRTDLNGIERDFFPAYPESSFNTSGFGHVPTLIFSLGTPTTGPFATTGLTGFVMDPDCGVENSIPAPFDGVSDPATGAAGFCRTDFSPSFGLVPEEKRHVGFMDGEITINDKLTAFGEMSFAFNTAVSTQATPPPVIREAVMIRSDHPDNPHGVDLLYFGRPAETASSPRPTENNYARFLAGLRYDINDTWDLETAYLYSMNDYSISNQDVLLDALTIESGNAVIPRAIRNDFNPFGSQYTGTGSVNSEQVMSEIIGAVQTNAKSSLKTADFSVSGDLGDKIELPGGTIGVAFGGQWRQDSLAIDYDANINRGVLGFEGGAPDTPEVSRDVYAAFGEAVLPIHDTVEVQVALRHESYEGSAGSTTDPKIALLWQPTDMVTVRGSWGTSFRAPSLFQANVGGQTNLAVAFDPFRNNPDGGCDVSNAGIIFPGARAKGNPDLTPENANALNAGIVVRPAEGLSLSVDFWRFEVDNIIVKENLQKILNDDCLDDGIANDPRLHRGPGGVVRDIDVAFINAASLTTEGLDFAGAYTLDAADMGSITLGARATYTRKYDYQQTVGGEVSEGAGSRNFNNPFAPAPKWRMNFNADWMMGNHSANVIVRHISSYNDDNNSNESISAHTTVDLQYSYLLEALFSDSDNTIVTVGMINVFDQDPPSVVAVQGFDSKVHDPRGRMVYAKLRKNF